MSDQADIDIFLHLGNGENFTPVLKQLDWVKPQSTSGDLTQIVTGPPPGTPLIDAVQRLSDMAAGLDRETRASWTRMTPHLEVRIGLQDDRGAVGLRFPPEVLKMLGEADVTLMTTMLGSEHEGRTGG